jgi:hypothetical protein
MSASSHLAEFRSDLAESSRNLEQFRRHLAESSRHLAVN